MDIFHAIILGLVEGITEFLPISSTAHLIITSKFLQLKQTDFLKLFEVFIQSGAILAVLIMYFKYIVGNPKIINKILVSFIPTAVIGFVFFKIIKNVFFESTLLIILMLFFVGLLFIILEMLISGKHIKIYKKISNMTYWHAFLIGVFQSFAIIPGVSRAGAVIASMIFMNYKRSESAIYSFLLAVPTIIAASILDVYKNYGLVFESVTNVRIIVIGFIVSFITAYFAVKWFISYLQKNSLIGFGIYRISLAIILFIIMFLGL
jgi:undecaprenyl-diphosphatase